MWTCEIHICHNQNKSPVDTTSVWKLPIVWNHGTLELFKRSKYVIFLFLGSPKSMSSLRILEWQAGHYRLLIRKAQIYALKLRLYLWHHQFICDMKFCIQGRILKFKLNFRLAYFRLASTMTLMTLDIRCSCLNLDPRVMPKNHGFLIRHKPIMDCNLGQRNSFIEYCKTLTMHTLCGRLTKSKIFI